MLPMGKGVGRVFGGHLVTAWYILLNFHGDIHSPRVVETKMTEDSLFVVRAVPLSAVLGWSWTVQCITTGNIPYHIH